MTHRFAVLSDIHLGLSGPQPDGRTYGDVTSVIREAVRQVGASDTAQVVLLGDIVNRGHAHEYSLARDVFAPLGERVVPVCGNHELQRADLSQFCEAWGCGTYCARTIGGLD